MTRRQLSITDIARAYSREDANLSDGDPASEAERCAACGALLPEEQSDELLPPACPACGRAIEGGD